MPRGRGGYGRGFGRGYGRSYGLGFGPGFGPNPYPYCRRFPWLPRWWWAGSYGYYQPYAINSRDDEIVLLGNQARLLEESLEQIRRRLEELEKEE
jgi:hypothetical protein